jgi:hypothetical protein
MNRTLTAAVALAAGLGLAGLAQAQQNGNNYEQSGKPTAGQQSAPSAFTSPGTNSPQTTIPPAPPPQASTQGTQQPAPKQPSMQGMNNMPSDEGRLQHSSMREHMIRGGRGHTTVAEAQRELKSQGLYNGPIDGKEGRQMKSALSQFQEQNGLKKTAQLDRETRDKLNQSGNSQQQPTTGATQPQSQPQNPAGTMQPQNQTGTTTR